MILFFGVSGSISQNWFNRMAMWRAICKYAFLEPMAMVTYSYDAKVQLCIDGLIIIDIHRKVYWIPADAMAAYNKIYDTALSKSI